MYLNEGRVSIVKPSELLLPNKGFVCDQYTVMYDDLYYTLNNGGRSEISAKITFFICKLYIYSLNGRGRSFTVKVF